MANFDFSHLKIATPMSVVRAMEMGTKISDEMYLEALNKIEPPLLRKDEMAALIKMLDPSKEKRGRPKKIAITKAQLETAVRAIDRADVPEKFVALLARRIKSGRKFTDADRSLQSGIKFEKLRRNMLIATVYEELHALIEPDVTEVNHPILGKHTLNTNFSGRREQALQLTKQIVERTSLIDLPDVDRMRNIVTEWNTGKRHKKS